MFCISSCTHRVCDNSCRCRYRCSCSCTSTCANHNHINNSNQSNWHNLNDVPVPTPSIDGSAISSSLISEFYSKIHQIGWASVQHMYSIDCSIIYDNQMFGSYDLLLYLSNSYIKRTECKIRGSTWVSNGSTVVITVSGEMRHINFIGEYGPVKPFADTFIVTTVDGVPSIMSHMAQ